MSVRCFCVVIALAGLLCAPHAGEICAQSAVCEIEITSLDFGFYRSSGVSSAGTLRVRCAEPIHYTIAVSPGESGSFRPRRMTGPHGLTFEYNLFTSSTYQEVWGDGSADTSTVSGTGNQTFTLYGLVPGGQQPAAGEYREHLVITLSH